MQMNKSLNKHFILKQLILMTFFNILFHFYKKKNMDQILFSLKFGYI